MVWQGVVQSLAPLLGGAAALWLWHRWTTSNETPVTDAPPWWTPADKAGLVSAAVLALMMWCAPGGALLGAPLLLLLSAASPAARADWREHARPRSAALGMALLCLLSSGALPVTKPVAPEAWGTPLFTENPNAPAYPASEQYTWVTSDVVILQSIAMRLPHQSGAWGAERSAMSLAAAFDLEVERMHQAIQLLDEEVPFVRLSAEDVLLVQVASPKDRDVRLPTGDTVSVELRRYDVRSTAFGTDASGTKVGEVVIAAKAGWGGQLDLLVVVRPVAHPTLSTDGFADVYTTAWLNARAG